MDILDLFQVQFKPIGMFVKCFVPFLFFKETINVVLVRRLRSLQICSLVCTGHVVQLLATCG